MTQYLDMKAYPSRYHYANGFQCRNAQLRAEYEQDRRLDADWRTRQYRQYRPGRRLFCLPSDILKGDRQDLSGMNPQTRIEP